MLQRTVHYRPLLFSKCGNVFSYNLYNFSKGGSCEKAHRCQSAFITTLSYRLFQLYTNDSNYRSNVNSHSRSYTYPNEYFAAADRETGGCLCPGTGGSTCLRVEWNSDYAECDCRGRR